MSNFRNMPTRIVILFFSLLFVHSSDAQESTQRIIQPFNVEDFRKLTSTQQSIYVAGIIEGMSYSYYGSKMPQYGEWALCIRQKTLGETAKEVAVFLDQQPEPEAGHGVSFAVAKVIGARCQR